MKRVFSGLLIVLLIGSGILWNGCGRMIEPGPTPPTPDTTAPTVTLTVPVNSATSVARNQKISATFSEIMAPTTINTTTFSLKQGTTDVSGTVAYTGVTAVFTPASNLASNTAYTATITTGARDLAGNALAVTKTWTFTTSAITDTTAPVVSSTSPADSATSVAINKKVAATFNEAMDPTTLTTTTFTLKQGTTAISGEVTYAGVIATFTPTSNLTANTTYTATITTGARDLASNALAANKTWSFTTDVSGTIDTSAPTVISTIQADLAEGVAVNSNITATFSKDMDPVTITNVTFTLMQGTTTIEGDVTYAGVIATFNPTSDLAANTIYVATIKTGAQDLAGNALAADKIWSFKTVAGLAPGAAPLGLASTYGIAAYSAITDASGASVVHGDVALYPGTSCGLLDAQVIGTKHITDGVAAATYTDLTAAYNFAKNTAPNLDPAFAVGTADLGLQNPLGGGAATLGHLPPGVYSSGSTMLIGVGNPVVLDAGGNADAVWIFQIGSSLTANANVTMANGGQAKNVFWVPSAAGSLGVGVTFNGNILAGGSVTTAGGATIYGRLLGGAIGAGTIALNGAASTVYVPAP